MNARYEACDTCHGVVNTRSGEIALFGQSELQPIVADLESEDLAWDFFGASSHEVTHERYAEVTS